jgi:Amt family ammonium transporter
MAALLSRNKNSDLAHELRTPITAILGYTNLLVEDFDGPADQLEKLLIIRNHSEYLLRLVNHLLSNPQDGMEVRPLPIDPVTLADEVVALMRPAIGKRHLTLGLELHGPLPQSIHSDEMRLRQVLINLLGNALKFTNEGYVKVGLRWQNEAPASLLITVADTGIGMDEVQLQSIFRPYVQVHSSSQRRGGAGLGLSTCSRLVRQLNGTLSVVSRPGLGTTFSVVLPGTGVSARDLSERSTSQTPASGLLSGKEILLSVSQADTRLLVSALLKGHDASLTLVESTGLVEMALASVGAERPFAMILLDGQSSSGSGVVGARALRAAGYHGPLVALGEDGDENWQRCRQAGFDALLSIPIDIERLLTVISDSENAPEH